jgi:hypothetical protein
MLIAGLSSAGESVIWHWGDGEIVRIDEVLAPPENLAAVVRAVYWPAAGQWVWPGRSGVIVFYDRRQKEVRSVSAHATDVYAVVVASNDLLTIGMDGTVQRWHPDADEPVDSCAGPEGIIAAAVWANRPSHLLLVNDQGKASVHSWAEGRLSFVRHLPGDHFRTALGPDMQKVESAMRHQEITHVKKICVRIKQAIAQGEADRVDGLHRQLVESGYEHASLALRAEEYRMTNDVVSELQCYKHLTGLLPQPDGRSKASFLRYAQLLETVWQQKKAYSIYERLADMHPANNGHIEAMCRISKKTSLVETGNCIVEADIPLPSLVRSATLLDEMFTGRYVFKGRQEPINCNVPVSAEEYIKRHEQRGSESKMMQAQHADLWWVSNTRTEQVTTITLASDNPGPFHRLELAIKFLDALQTVLVPVVVYNACKMRGEASSCERHNQEVLEELQHLLTDGPSFKGWLKIVYSDAMSVVRQLITKAVADRNR